MTAGVFGSRFAVAGLAGALAWTPVAMAEEPRDIIQGWLAQGEALDWLVVEVGAIAHDDATGLTTVRDLSIKVELTDLPAAESGDENADISYVFAFPEIAFQNLAADGVYYSAASIAADTVDISMVMTAPGQGTATSTGAYKGLSAMNLRWARWPTVADDPQRPISRYYPLAAALVDVSFDEMSMGAFYLEMETPDSGLTSRMDYGAAIIGRAVRGNISSMTLDGVSLAGEAEEAGGEPFEMHVGPMEVRNYNYGDMVRLFDPELPPGVAGAEYEEMIGLVSVRDWRILAGETTVTIEELRMEDLGGRRPVLPVLSRADALYLQAEESDEEPDTLELLELVGAAYGTLRLGRAESRGVAFEGGGFEGRIDAVGTAGLSSDGIEEIYYRGIGFQETGGQMRMALGEFSVTGIGFPSLMALANLEQAQAEGDIDTMLAAMPIIGGVSLSGLMVHMPGIAELSLARTSLLTGGHIGPIPTRIVHDLVGLRLPTWMLEGEAEEILGALGYETLAAGYGFELGWNPGDDTIALSTLIDMEGMGSFSLQGLIGGVPQELFSNPMVAPFLAPMTDLISAEARFVDASITGRAMDMVAAQQGIDVTTLRSQAVALLPFVLAELRRPDFMMMVITAATHFLENQGSLTITMSPDEPVPLIEVMTLVEDDPVAVIDMLNVEVRSE